MDEINKQLVARDNDPLVEAIVRTYGIEHSSKPLKEEVSLRPNPTPEDPYRWSDPLPHQIFNRYEECTSFIDSLGLW